MTMRVPTHLTLAVRTTEDGFPVQKPAWQPGIANPNHGNSAATCRVYMHCRQHGCASGIVFSWYVKDLLYPLERDGRKWVPLYGANCKRKRDAAGALSSSMPAELGATVCKESHPPGGASTCGKLLQKEGIRNNQGGPCLADDSALGSEKRHVVGTWPLAVCPARRLA